MFHSYHLSTTLNTDRQARFRRAATRQRIVSRNKAPSAGAPPGRVLSLILSDDADPVPSQQRAHCVA